MKWGRRHRTALLLAFALAAACVACAAHPRDSVCCTPGVVDASCWGYNAVDATDALQSAINCAVASTVSVPFVSGSDGVWSVAPIRLNASDQTVALGSGVVVQALRGAFHGLHDCLFSAVRVSGVALTGHPDGTSQLVMRKADYANASVYAHSEWRHGVEVNACVNFTLRDVSIAQTGGDGVYVGVNSRDTVVTRVHVDGAYRNGMSVTGAVGLTVDSCTFTRASGTCCWGGVDIEPEAESHAITDVLFRNCSFGQNKGNNFVVSLGAQTQRPDTIRVLNCTVYGGESGGILVLNAEPHPNPSARGGSVEFVDVVVRDTPGHPIAVQHKSASGAALLFERVTVLHSARKHDVASVISVSAGAFADGAPVGGVTFRALRVHDTRNRTFLTASSSDGRVLANVTGDAEVYNPFAASAPQVVCVPVFEPLNATQSDAIAVTTCAVAAAAAAATP